MLEDTLRAYITEIKGNWDSHRPLIEFTYKNNYQSSLQMAAYEALYKRPCRSPVY